ncbi:hypothetical protein PMAYCL1PPCAC_23846, partial [Pristionchus mayeri]
QLTSSNEKEVIVDSWMEQLRWRTSPIVPNSSSDVIKNIFSSTVSEVESIPFLSMAQTPLTSLIRRAALLHPPTQKIFPFGLSEERAYRFIINYHILNSNIVTV